MRALKYPNDVVDDVVQLVYLHLRIHTYAMGWTDKAVRRYVRDAGDLLDELNHLQRCDCTTRNQNRARALQRRMDDLERRIAELREQEELDAIRPPLDGRQVMEHLGVKPGRVVGEALDFLLEARLDDGPIERGRRLRPPRRLGRERAASPRGDHAPRAARATSVRRLPCGRATRWSAGTRAPGVSGRGSRIVSTRKPARPSSVNTSPMPRGVRRAPSRRGARRRSGPGRSTSARPRRRRRCTATSGARRRTRTVRSASAPAAPGGTAAPTSSTSATEYGAERERRSTRRGGTRGRRGRPCATRPSPPPARRAPRASASSASDASSAMTIAPCCAKVIAAAAGAAPEVEDALARELAEQSQLAVGRGRRRSHVLIHRAFQLTRRSRTAPPSRGPRRRGTAPRATS